MRECVVVYMDTLSVYGYMVSVLLLVAGALNHMLALLGVHVFTNYYLRATFYTLVGWAGIYLMFNRNTYLPFLGPAALPDSVLAPAAQVGPSLRTYVLRDVPEEAHFVLYWATLPGEKKDSMLEAYGDFSNSGVARRLDLRVAATLAELNSMAAGEQDAARREALQDAVRTVREEALRRGTPPEALYAEWRALGSFAVLRIRCPSAYRSFFGATVDSHIAYRYSYRGRGDVSEVMEIYERVPGCGAGQ